MKNTNKQKNGAKKLFKAAVENVNKNCDPELKVTDGGVVFPYIYSEDKKGNIDFDLTSMEDIFDALMLNLREHNDTTSFDWNNTI